MLFVGMYVSWSDSVNARHSMSSGCGGVMLWSLWRPIKAISMLKLPHTICV